MRRFWEAIDRYFLLNPWLSRIGNVATALFLAGIVGGLVAVILNFPMIPLVTTMVGAFLMALRGTQVVAEKMRPELRSQKLAEEALALADDIDAFVAERKRTDPTPSPLAGILKKEGEEEDSRKQLARVVAQMKHKAESKERYEREFAPRVYRVVGEMQAGNHLKESEAERLNFPKDQQARSRVARRLRELGRRIG